MPASSLALAPAALPRAPQLLQPRRLRAAATPLARLPRRFMAYRHYFRRSLLSLSSAIIIIFFRYFRFGRRASYRRSLMAIQRL